MRRWLWLAVVFIMLACVLAGCKKEPKNYTLGICLPPVSDSWQGSLLPPAREAAEAWGGNFVVTIAPEIPGSLMAAVDELIAEKVDIVVMYAYDAAEGERAAAKLVEAKIPLVLVGNAIDGENYAALVCADNLSVGRMAGEYIAQRLNGAGKIFVLEGVPGETTDLRNQGFGEAIAGYPGLAIVASDNCGNLADVAATNVKLRMAQDDGIDAIFAHSDEMALGAIEPLEEIYAQVQAVVGIGGSKTVIASIAKNHRYLKLTFAYPESASAKAVETAISLLEGEKPPEDKHVLIKLTPVDPKNAQELYDENALY